MKLLLAKRDTFPNFEIFKKVFGFLMNFTIVCIAGTTLKCDLPNVCAPVCNRRARTLFLILLKLFKLLLQKNVFVRAIALLKFEKYIFLKK